MRPGTPYARGRRRHTAQRPVAGVLRGTVVPTGDPDAGHQSAQIPLPGSRVGVIEVGTLHPPSVDRGVRLRSDRPMAYRSSRKVAGWRRETNPLLSAGREGHADRQLLRRRDRTARTSPRNSTTRELHATSLYVVIVVRRRYCPGTRDSTARGAAGRPGQTEPLMLARSGVLAGQDSDHPRRHIASVPLLRCFLLGTRPYLNPN